MRIQGWFHRYIYRSHIRFLVKATMPGFLCCILRLYIYNTVHQLANERHRMAAVSSSFASCLHKYESLITPRHRLSTAGWAIYASANTAGATADFKLVTTVTARLIKMRTVDLYRFSALMYVIENPARFRLPEAHSRCKYTSASDMQNGLARVC